MQCICWRIWTGQNQVLREKLRRAMYPEKAVEGAVEYVRSFGYLDDGRLRRISSGVVRI